MTEHYFGMGVCTSTMAMLMTIVFYLGTSAGAQNDYAVNVCGAVAIASWTTLLLLLVLQLRG